MPYWIDDPTLFSSIQQSGAEDIVDKEGLTNSVLYREMLPHTEDGVPRQRGEKRPSLTLPSVAALNPVPGRVGDIVWMTIKCMSVVFVLSCVDPHNG